MFAQVISFDVKPENILLDHSMTVAKLTDVGLAKILLDDHTFTQMVRITLQPITITSLVPLHMPQTTGWVLSRKNNPHKLRLRSD